MNGHQKEVVLAVVEGDSPGQRLVFATKTGASERPILLRQESYSPDVGWFTQSCIEMTRQEMVLLRNAMGGKTPNACMGTSQRIQAQHSQPSHSLKICDMPAAS